MRYSYGCSLGAGLSQWEPPYLAGECSTDNGMAFIFDKFISAKKDDQIPFARLSYITGDPLESLSRSLMIKTCGERCQEAFLCNYFFMDVLLINEDQSPLSLTLFQGIDKNKKLKQSVWTGREKTDHNFESGGKILSNLGIEELWNKMVGKVRPSWGGYRSKEKDKLFVSTPNIMISVLSPSDCMRNSDFEYFDLDRLEHILDFEEIPFKRARSIPEIQKSIKIISGQTSRLKDLDSVVEKGFEDPGDNFLR